MEEKIREWAARAPPDLAKEMLEYIDSEFPLHEAVTNRDSMSIQKHCNQHLTQLNHEGLAPLHLAVKLGQVAEVQLLLACSSLAERNVCTRKGENALDVLWDQKFPYEKHSKLTKMLVEGGVKIR